MASATYGPFERIAISAVAEGVLECSLARPKKLNAFDPLMWDEIRRFFEAVAYDHECRCILLTGSGRVFTAGLDLMNSGGLTGGSGPLEAEEGSDDIGRRGLKIRRTGKEWQASFTNMAECGKPVVACVHGACIGAGIEMISAADVRFCSSDAFFEMAEVDVALAADVGGLQRFPKLVGNDSWVRELALSGRRFDAAEALRMGFVSRVVADGGRDALVAEGLELCRTIAQKSPLATLGVKTFLNYSRDHTVQDSLEYALTWNQAAVQSDDMATAGAAKMMKAQADFPALPAPRKSKL